MYIDEVDRFLGNRWQSITRDVSGEVSTSPSQDVQGT